MGSGGGRRFERDSLFKETVEIARSIVVRTWRTRKVEKVERKNGYNCRQMYRNVLEKDGTADNSFYDCEAFSKDGLLRK